MTRRIRNRFKKAGSASELASKCKIGSGSESASNKNQNPDLHESDKSDPDPQHWVRQRSEFIILSYGCLGSVTDPQPLSFDYSFLKLDL